MTIVIVGGGPTGVELAGSFAELTRTVLSHDFRRIDPTQARIILIEGGSAVLSHLPPELSASAQRQLEALGVKVRTGTKVQDIRLGEVELAGGEIIRAEISSGPPASRPRRSPKSWGVELDRAGRVKVKPDLSLPDQPEIFAIGDMALVPGADGKTRPRCLTGGDADGPARGKNHRGRNSFRRESSGASGVQVLGQGHDGDHRAFGGGGVDRTVQIFRFAGMAGVAVRAPDFSHRLPQPCHRAVQLDVFVFLLQTQRPADHVPAAGTGKLNARTRPGSWHAALTIFPAKLRSRAWKNPPSDRCS